MSIELIRWHLLIDDCLGLGMGMWLFSLFVGSIETLHILLLLGSLLLFGGLDGLEVCNQFQLGLSTCSPILIEVL